MRHCSLNAALLKLPAASWPATVPGPDGQLLDVLVIGAGMYGLAAAAALVFKGVRNLLVVDRSPDGHEGPWTTYARMDTLRSPKDLPGPAIGIPSLTFRAWYEARHGTRAFDRLYKTSPWTLIGASENDVGLPKGQMGNSEVGHLNLGAGRIVYQDIVRIDKAIELTYMEPPDKRRMAERILGEYPRALAQMLDFLEANPMDETPAQFQERCAQIALRCFWQDRRATEVLGEERTMEPV